MCSSDVAIDKTPSCYSLASRDFFAKYPRMAESFDTKYQILSSIGIGCYSEVFKVRSIAHTNGWNSLFEHSRTIGTFPRLISGLFAAKKIHVKHLNCADSTLVKEIDILKMISHHNIVSLLDYATSSKLIQF